MLTSGTRMGPYEIHSPLGAGGMGEVYKARDTRLGREVAVKVLPAEFAQDAERLRRFEQEARATAALDHPNILGIFDIGTYEGTPYIVEQLLEGESLRQRLRGGQLTASKAVEFGIQIAQGLAAAHDKGIVHRDLKPENLFLTKDGRIKILDFGLARLRPDAGTGCAKSAAATADLPTREGTILGTIGYMAPEQARGEPADARSDVFSFGVVLYEMLSGKRPFERGSAAESMAALLKEDPPPLPGPLPGPLGKVLQRCLEKSTGDRFQSARELETALDAASASARPAILFPGLPALAAKRWVGGVGAAALVLLVALLGAWALRSGWPSRNLKEAAIRSIAVLPLANLSGDPAQEYFSDGMTDELITDLAKIASLRVISRTTTMKYKGSGKGLPQIAKELNVDAVIEGSVLREGDRVRITAQLIQASTDKHLWAESYERDLKSVLQLQGEIARAVAGKVQAVLTPAEQGRLASARPVDPEAYELYLKGKFYLDKMTPEGFEKALACLHQAIEKDPADPRSYAQLALTYSVMGHGGQPGAFERAKAAMSKAEELGGEPSAEMLAAAGMTKLYWDWDYEGAAKDLRRAIELNSSLGEAHRDYSWYLFLIGRRTEALARVRQAQEVEPLTPLFYADRGWQYGWMGMQDKAVEESLKSLELAPNFVWGLCALGAAYAEQGRYEEAIAAHRKLGAVDRTFRWCLVQTLVQAGRPDEARTAMARFLSEKPDPVPDMESWFVAEAYAAVGDKDKALFWLEQAYSARNTLLPWLEDNPAYAPLRSDPRFRDLVRRMNVPREVKT